MNNKNTTPINAREVTKTIAEYINQGKTLEASGATVHLLLSLLDDVEHDRRPIDDFCDVCHFIFFDISNSRDYLPTDIIGLLPLAMDLSWYFYGTAKNKKEYIKWKNHVRSDLENWLQTKDLSNRTILLKQVKVGDKYVNVPYSKRRGD